MEKKDHIRNFISEYIDSKSDYRQESITRYIELNKNKIKQDKQKIIDFYKANFMICGINMSYDALRYDSYGNEWIRLDNRRDLELFEQLIAVGYEAKIFNDSYLLRFIESKKLPREELKYRLPEEFEYLDEEYYEGLNKYIIQNGYLYITSQYYDEIERTCSTQDLLRYWFVTNNVPNAIEKCERFQYMLMYNEDELLNVATFLHVNGCGPIALLMELNKDIESDILAKVDYLVHTMDDKKKEVFNKHKELFLKVVESEYKKSIIQKKKGLK